MFVRKLLQTSNLTVAKALRILELSDSINVDEVVMASRKFLRKQPFKIFREVFLHQEITLQDCAKIYQDIYQVICQIFKKSLKF